MPRGVPPCRKAENMNFDIRWNHEIYRSAAKSEKHWQLTVDFITTHKDRFPEERLICLARAFADDQYMGSTPIVQTNPTNKNNEDCYFYYYSKCNKGSFCRFRHEPAALGNEVMCNNWKSGQCFKANCSFRHMYIEKERSQIQCYWETQPTGCLKPHCPFMHQSARSNPGEDKNWGQQRQQNVKTSLFEEIIDPLKLFIGNIKPFTFNYQLLEKLSMYANINSVFISKNAPTHSYISDKTKNPTEPTKVALKKRDQVLHGFVSLPTEDDVKKLLALNDKQIVLCGNKLVFHRTRRRLPGEEGFVRQPLSDRDYDLSPVDPSKPFIHVLNDDVMLKILDYLPLKERISCEIVCRRWQSLLYTVFEGKTYLNIRERYFVNHSYLRCKVSMAMLSKLLLLSGEQLKDLSLKHTNAAENMRLFCIIAQLCPNLEYLDLSNFWSDKGCDQINQCFENIESLKVCTNLKGFSAGSGLYGLSVIQLISNVPSLEKIDITNSEIMGNCFENLTLNLKELKINFCYDVSYGGLTKLSKACKNLEVLEMENVKVGSEFFKELAINYPNLKILKFHTTEELSAHIKSFTKLTNLKIDAFEFELPNIAEVLNSLEELSIRIKYNTTRKVDFGKFAHLRKVEIISSPFSKQELWSLEKCKKLQDVTIKCCDNANKEVVKRIVKGCPDIKDIFCPIEGVIDVKFVTYINEVMKNRTEPIKVAIKEKDQVALVMLDIKYDENKIKFYHNHSGNEGYSVKKNVDHSDVDLYNSDASFDANDFYLNGMWDSDDSIPDRCYYFDLSGVYG